MPGRWLVRTSVVAIALLGGGCGTLTNITNYAPDDVGGGQRRIYGGLVWDLKGEYRALTTPFPNYFLGIHPQMIFAYLLDIPLSAFGDTITLPITIGQALGITLPPWPPPNEYTGEFGGTTVLAPTQLPAPREITNPPAMPPGM